MFDKPIEYDATLLKEKGQALVKRISDDVNSHESFVLGSIPSLLKVTEDQYQDLAGEEAFEGMKIIEELTGEVKAAADKQMFYTEEKVNVFGKHSGGYILEVEVI